MVYLMGSVTAPFQFTYTGIILIGIATKVMAGHEVPFFAVPADYPGGRFGFIQNNNTLLHKLYFLPQATGKGYGEGVIQEVTRRARKHGERFLWLEVLDANPQARRFYERQGFEHVRDTVFSTASQQSTLHILGKVI